MAIEFINTIQYSRETGYNGPDYSSSEAALQLRAIEKEQTTADISFEILGGDVQYFQQSGYTFILGRGPAAGFFPLGADFDHPIKNTYTIDVKATSSWTNEAGPQTRIEYGTFQLVITDTPPPSLEAFSNPVFEESFRISEGTGGGRAVISTLFATSNFGDSDNAPSTDGGGRLVYTLIDNDGGNFEFFDVENGAKWLRTTENASLQVGPDGTASRYVTVQVTDGTNTNNARIKIDVKSVAPTAPTDTDFAGNDVNVAGFVAENAAVGTAVGITVRSTDPGAAALRYSIQNGQGFAIDPETGVVTVSDPSQFNFEAASTRSVTVAATDGLHNSFSTFVVAVGDVNEAPQIQFSDSLFFHATEGVSGVPGFIPARDIDRGDTVTLSVEGADGHLFSIDETSQLVFRTAPDFERPQDADLDNNYDVTIVATDRGGLSDRRDIKVAVANVNEAPIIVTERMTVESGTQAIGRIQASDPDGDALTFDFVSGDYESQGRFILQPNGQVTFWTNKTYDPDIPSNNIFSLPVSVTDRESGGLTVTKTITVEILAPGTGSADTVAPSAPNLRLLNDTGRSASDHVTGDARLFITPSEAGGSLSFSINGQASDTYDAASLQTGAYRVEVFHRDAAGNTSAPSEVSFVLDRDAPNTRADSASGTAGGTALTGNVLANDTDRLALSVASIQLGTASEQALSPDGAESVTVSGASGVLTLAADGAYSFRPIQAGSDVFTQTIKDAAGNTSQTTLTFTVAPAQTGPSDPSTPGSSGGSSGSGPSGGGSSGGGVTPTIPAIPSTGGTASPAAGQTQTVTGITSGSLVVEGAGKVELTGTNSYTGPTEVKSGTLVVNGSIVSPVTVQAGATLGGSGSTGTVAVASGGTLSPGNSPGILSTKDLSLAAGASLRQEIGGTASGQFDQLKVTGTVALSGASLAVESFGGFTSARGDRFVIIENDGQDAVTGQFTGLAEGATFSVGDRSLRISYRGGDGNDVTLTDTTGHKFSPASFGTLETSAEGAAGAVYGLYEALLNRAPDALGLSSFVTAMENGASVADVARAILASPEHGGQAQTQSASAFVESVYANLLNRGADAEGLAGWTGALANGMGHAGVAAQIATSAEAKAVLAPSFAPGMMVIDVSEASVARLYYGLLERAPDAGGLQAFSLQVESGPGGAAGEAGRLAQAASAILSSPEYGAKHAGLSDAAFVLDLYRDALGRTPDSSGEAYYVNALTQGASRAQVALDITQSVEAQAYWFNAIYDGTLVA